MSEPLSPQFNALFWEVASYTVPSYNVLVWLGAIMTGAVCIQCVNFFSKGSDDPVHLKAMAIGVTLLQVLCSVFEIWGHNQQVQVAIKHEIGAVVLLPWTDSPVITCSMLTSMTVQFYFGRLIWRLAKASGNKFWPVLWIVVFSLLTGVVVVGGIGSTYFFARVTKDYFKNGIVGLVGAPVTFYLTWLAGAAALDLTLSSILVYRFLSEVRKDGFKETNSTLHHLAIYTLETFSLTATLALVDLGCAVVVATASDYLKVTKMEIVCYFLTVVISRAYATSFLFTLSRHADLRRRGLPSDTTIGTSYHNHSPNSSRPSRRKMEKHFPTVDFKTFESHSQTNSQHPGMVDDEVELEGVVRSGGGEVSVELVEKDSERYLSASNGGYRPGGIKIQRDMRVDVETGSVDENRDYKLSDRMRAGYCDRDSVDHAV